jgi:hypothetical protein
MSTTPGAPDVPAPLPILRVVSDPRYGQRVVVAFLSCRACGRRLRGTTDGLAECEVCGSKVDIARAITVEG